MSKKNNIGFETDVKLGKKCFRVQDDSEALVVWTQRPTSSGATLDDTKKTRCWRLNVGMRPSLSVSVQGRVHTAELLFGLF